MPRHDSPAAIRVALACYLAIAYSGALNYMPAKRVWFLDALVGFMGLHCILRERGAWRRLPVVLPFMLWVVVYYALGVLVADNATEVREKVVTALLAYPLTIGVAGVILRDRRQLALFSSLVQVIVIAECVVSMLQALHLPLLVVMSDAGGAGYIAARPVALWRNPNDAAFYFVFAALLSYWSRGPLAWTGRVASVTGATLAASRAGVYLLLIFAVLFAVQQAVTRPSRLSWCVIARRVLIPVCLLAAAAYMLVATSDISQWASDPARGGRILDIGQRNSGTKRQDVLSAWLPRIIDGPLQGSGIFSCQGLGSGGPRMGTHNVYLAIWGEVGLPLCLCYLGLLFRAARSCIAGGLASEDRYLLVCIMSLWLFLGFVTHNQLEYRPYAVILGVLLAAPSAIVPLMTRERARRPRRLSAATRPVGG